MFLNLEMKNNVFFESMDDSYIKISLIYLCYIRAIHCTNEVDKINQNTLI